MQENSTAWSMNAWVPSYELVRNSQVAVSSNFFIVVFLFHTAGSCNSMYWAGSWEILNFKTVSTQTLTVLPHTHRRSRFTNTCPTQLSCILLWAESVILQATVLLSSLLLVFNYVMLRQKIQHTSPSRQKEWQLKIGQSNNWKNVCRNAGYSTYIVPDIYTYYRK